MGVLPGLSEERKLSFVNVHTISNMKIRNWKYNRPIDISRIPSIKNYILKTKRVEGIICLAYSVDDDTFYCYDGIHRITSIQEIIKEQLNFTDILGLNDIHNIYEMDQQ